MIVEYFASKPLKRKSRIESELNIMMTDPKCGDMVSKHRTDMPVWVFVESVSFGTFIDFYKFCADRWGDSGLLDEHYLLKQVKSARNATVHSSNMVNGFAKIYSRVGNYRPVSDALAAIGISKSQRRTKICNTAIQRITAVLFTYNRLVLAETSQERTTKSLSELKYRFDLHKWYYQTNDSI